MQWWGVGGFSYDVFRFGSKKRRFARNHGESAIIPLDRVCVCRALGVTLRWGGTLGGAAATTSSSHTGGRRSTTSPTTAPAAPWSSTPARGWCTWRCSSAASRCSSTRWRPVTRCAIHRVTRCACPWCPRQDACASPAGTIWGRHTMSTEQSQGSGRHYSRRWDVEALCSSLRRLSAHGGPSWP